MSQLLDVKSLVVEHDLYPRNSVNWLTVVQYQSALERGAKFPPILVATYKGQKLIVDGAHRVGAHKAAKIGKIAAVVKRNWDAGRIFSEAVKANAAHGLRFSPYDTRRAIVRLRDEFDFSTTDISGFVQIPIGKMEKMVADTFQATGIAQFVKKAVVRDMDLSSTPNAQAAQDVFRAQNQHQLLDEILVLLENNWITIDDKELMEKCEKAGRMLLNLSVVV